ncbi:MAG: DUF2911 domain-containing protein [Ferruginibacter sp.]
MIRFYISVIILLISGICYSQQKLPAIDKSPMDMSYYPAGYPVLKIQDKVKDPLIARVIFSRPQKNGRVIFGELIEYGKVWRLGANEATEIEFFQNVIINNVKVKKGRYSLYAIPDTSKWTIILNKETDTWGSFKYDLKKDVLRMTVPVEKQSEIAESLVMSFEKAKNGITLLMVWDDVVVRLPISQ